MKRLLNFLLGLKDEIAEYLGLKGDTFSFTPTKYLWDIGLAYYCDKYGSHSYPVYYTYPKFEKSDYQFIDEGDLVWVRLEDLHRFIPDVLNRTEAKFFLFTGGGDDSAPGRFLKEAETLIHSGKIFHWFTHNYDGHYDDTEVSDFITPLPVGFDFHTRARRNYVSWAEIFDGYLTTYRRQSPHDQEIEFLQILKKCKPRQERVMKVYADFYLNNSSHRRKFGETRAEIYEQIGANDCFAFQKKRLRRKDYWEKMADFIFVISPHGNGMDCLRTWEALALGCIPIVKKSPLDRLYQGLPVVIVEDWREIDEQNLAEWELQYRRINPRQVQEKLSMNYWYNQKIYPHLQERKRLSVVLSSDSSGVAGV